MINSERLIRITFGADEDIQDLIAILDNELISSIPSTETSQALAASLKSYLVSIDLTRI